MTHVLTRWCFGYLLQAKPKHTAAGHESYTRVACNLKMRLQSIKSASFEEMKREYPDILYKYRTWTDKYHKTVLTQKQLYYSPPSEFEDPKDCKPIVRYDLLSTKERMKWMEYKLKQQNPGRTRQFYRSEARKLFKTAPIADNNQIKQLQKDTFEEHNIRMGVLSLTGNPNNDKMWNKYADDMKGYCIGFDPFILFKQLGGGGMVNYSPELPIVYPEPKHSHTEQMFYQVFCKEDKWSFEEEYRTHTFRSSPMSDNDRIIKVPANAFKTLILGKNMSEEHKAEIVRNLHLDIKEIEIIEK